MELLVSRSVFMFINKAFSPLLLANTLTAFNSNFLKNALILIVLVTLSQDASEAMSAFVSATFMIPMIFLSGIGGQLADNLDRRQLSRSLKGLELIAVGVAVAGVVTTNFWLVLAGLIGMQIVAALFGPVRGSLIPDLVSRDDVPSANGWIEAGTLCAMILGVWLVGLAFSYDALTRSLITSAVMCVSVAVFLVVNFLPDLPIRPPLKKTDWHLFRSTFHVLKLASTDVAVRNSVFLVAWGWFLSSLVLSTAPAIVKRVGGDPQTISYAMMILGVSGAVGAQVAGRLSKHLSFGVTVSSGFCGLGFSIVALGSIAAQGFSVTPIMVTAGLMGLAAYSFSFVLIPLASRIQVSSAPENRAKTVAGSNVLNALAMVSGGYVVAALQAGGVDLSLIYLSVGIGTVLLPVMARPVFATTTAHSQG